MSSAAIWGERPVRDCMTLIPHSVTVDQSVSDALARMSALGVHHLPVVLGEEVVGVVVERELSPLMERIDPDPDKTCVGDVVTRDSCLVVDSGESLLSVAQAMADRGIDCCVVTDAQRIAGIMTARDATRLLASILVDSSPSGPPAVRPSQVRRRILAEHTLLRTLYAKTVATARSVLAGDADAGAQLPESCRELYRTMLRHIEMENAVLAPALRQVDAFGPVRADELLREHLRQRDMLLEALAASDVTPPLELAHGVLALVAELLTDMAHEERALLHPDLLRDDPISMDENGG